MNINFKVASLISIPSERSEIASGKVEKNALSCFEVHVKLKGNVTEVMRNIFVMERIVAKQLGLAGIVILSIFNAISMSRARLIFLYH